MKDSWTHLTRDNSAIFSTSPAKSVRFLQHAQNNIRLGCIGKPLSTEQAQSQTKKLLINLRRPNELTNEGQLLNLPLFLLSPLYNFKRQTSSVLSLLEERRLRLVVCGVETGDIPIFRFTKLEELEAFSSVDCSVVLVGAS